MREDLIDHGPLRDKGDDSHGTVAGRARVRVDFEVLLQERRHAAGGLGRRQSGRWNDRRSTDRGELGVTAHATRAIGDQPSTAL